MDPVKITGAFAAPPPGAPQEVTQPVDQDVMAERIAQARARRVASGLPAEAELPAYAPQPSQQTPSVIVSPSGEPVASEPNAADRLLEAARAQRQEPDRAHQPAASNTDSPSRGVPRPIADPNKAITGGWGHGERQYYAITGLELQEVVRGLMDQMNTRITNDLRFAIALVYPKLSVRLVLEVEAEVGNGGFSVQQVKVPEPKTLIEAAHEASEDVVFVLREVIREFDETGAAENPPDRMRETHGLPIPSKRTIQAGAARIIVDVVPDLGETF